MRLPNANTHLAIYVYDTPPWEGGHPRAISLCTRARKTPEPLVELPSLVTCLECQLVIARLELTDEIWRLADEAGDAAGAAGD